MVVIKFKKLGKKALRKARQELKIIKKIARHRYHPLIHKVHKKSGLSKKTLLYIKEYGPHSNIPKVIINESLLILLVASLISSIGGIALEKIKELFVTILPILILLPFLNDMIGDYGTIITSKYSTMLHEQLETRKLKRELNKLLAQLLIVGLFFAFLGVVIASAISSFFSQFNFIIALKVFAIVMINTIFIISLMFLIALLAGKYYYKKGEDPNNFLIPITTSFADFLNMFVLALLIVLFI
ncbi:MAG: magnesium transporter [Candidatus Pacearchaeota archaeon]